GARRQAASNQSSSSAPVEITAEGWGRGSVPLSGSSRISPAPTASSPRSASSVASCDGVTPSRMRWTGLSPSPGTRAATRSRAAASSAVPVGGSSATRLRARRVMPRERSTAKPSASRRCSGCQPAIRASARRVPARGRGGGGEDGRRERRFTRPSLPSGGGRRRAASLDSTPSPTRRDPDMSVDPNIDQQAHDPEDSERPAEDPELREAQELEARMRRALATKEDPLRDGESTSERLRRLEAADAEGEEPAGS